MFNQNKYISGACNISTKGGSKWNFEIFKKIFNLNSARDIDHIIIHFEGLDVIFAGINIITRSALCFVMVSRR